MGTTKKYWKGIEELNETPEFLQSKQQEFAGYQTIEQFLGNEKIEESSSNRRDFLKFLGFSVAAATVAACESPVTKIIPYVNKPENVTPGMATWYASTYYDGNAYGSILVKTREGRPIYIKGNRDQGINKGAVNAQIIASVLGLYESSRLTDALEDGKVGTLSAIDGKIMKAVKEANKVTLFSNSIISPSLNKAIGTFASKLGEGKFEHIQYDAQSYAGMRAANKESFGLVVEGTENGIIPDYDFSKAKTVVSVGADFLNSWLLATQFTHQFSLTRNPDNDWMSKLFVFESQMSITGSNADYRGMIKPSEQANVLAYMLKAFGVSTDVSTALSEPTKAIADLAVAELKASKAESIVVAGSNSKAVQILANKLNEVVGAYTKTINVNNPINLFQSEDEKVQKFVSDVIGGKASDVVIFLDTNPAYSLPNADEFGKAISKIKTSVAISQFADETAAKCKYIIPELHALESWNDYQPTKTHFATAQPTIRPLAENTTSPIESFLVWAGAAFRGGKDSRVAYDYIKSNWETERFATQSSYTTPDSYWDMMVHNSCYDLTVADPSAPSFNASLNVASQLPKVSGATEVVLYQKASIGVGIQAANPWLQEMPDPMTKVTWDNCFTMNPADPAYSYRKTYDERHGLSLATLTVGETKITLPVYPLPGQAIGTIGIALGYGRGANGEKIGKGAYQVAEFGGHELDENGKPKPIGANAFKLVTFQGGSYSYESAGALSGEEGEYLIAATQLHHTVMARESIIRETTLETYKKGEKESFNPAHTLQKINKEGHHEEVPISEFNLWDDHPVENVGHRWVMSIDLNKCFGCGACLIACQSENNVPVVGKHEVRKGREMHWLRIDRYFSSDVEASIGTRKDPDTFDYHAAEVAQQNPKVVHMPMMCQHCNHAPCETVCPVSATTHSNEGLNQMTYNRCIGTRYCANNCPYKVRRFNWYNYPSYKKFTEINPAQDDLSRLVLNPDVTVRTRGVMEKCTFCVQNIQTSKLQAKVEGRPVIDGEVNTACKEACPSEAISFGDWNDVNSLVRHESSSTRSYQALEEVGTKPNVYYQVKVRNEKNDILEAIQSARVAEVKHH
ncbi:MAG: TAT-variant-translocated molybdopterin oxidoreductase [Crocinitomicaceae bacterium]|nr:TAT-variant-translocated molybdopterin oxidoreductase [Crocinitomicaceae bacterium]